MLKSLEYKLHKLGITADYPRGGYQIEVKDKKIFIDGSLLDGLEDELEKNAIIQAFINDIN